MSHYVTPKKRGKLVTTEEQAPREDAHAAEGVQADMAGDPANYPPEQ